MACGYYEEENARNIDSYGSVIYHTGCNQSIGIVWAVSPDSDEGLSLKNLGHFQILNV